MWQHSSLQAHFDKGAAAYAPGGGDEWTRSQFVWNAQSVSIHQTVDGATADVVLNPGETSGYSNNLLTFFLIRAGNQRVLVNERVVHGTGIENVPVQGAVWITDDELLLCEVTLAVAFELPGAISPRAWT